MVNKEVYSSDTVNIMGIHSCTRQVNYYVFELASIGYWCIWLSCTYCQVKYRFIHFYKGGIYIHFFQKERVLNMFVCITFYLHLPSIIPATSCRNLKSFHRSKETAKLKSTSPVNRLLEIYGGWHWQKTEKIEINTPCLSIGRSL